MTQNSAGYESMFGVSSSRVLTAEAIIRANTTNTVVIRVIRATVESVRRHCEFGTAKCYGQGHTGRD
jgi:hypothetical protein